MNCNGCGEELRFPMLVDCCGASMCVCCALEVTQIDHTEMTEEEVFVYMLKTLGFIRVCDENRNSLTFRNAKPAFRTTNNYIERKNCPFCSAATYQVYPNKALYELLHEIEPLQDKEEKEEKEEKKETETKTKKATGWSSWA